MDGRVDSKLQGGRHGSALQAAAALDSRTLKRIIEMLVEAGADPNVGGGKHGTALQTAVHNNNKPVIKQLMVNGANVDIVG